MTVVFFSRLFYPHIGGVEKHVLEISKLLIKDGHKVIVITEEIENCKIKKEQYIGIDIYRIPVGQNQKSKKWIIWKWLWQNKFLIENADIIHCHDVFFWHLPFRFIYPFKPVYTTFHGYETNEQKSNHGPAKEIKNKNEITKKAIIVRKISELLSWGNICVGEFISKWYGTKPNFVTYGGVNRIMNYEPRLNRGELRIKNPNNDNNEKVTERDSGPVFDEARQARMTNKKIKIAFIGRLEPDTGVDIYLKALKILKSQKFPFTFEAFGNGSSGKNCEKFGTVYGFIENVQEKILQADLVFASSYLSILDALYLKKPVFTVYNNPLKRDYLELTPFKNWIWIGSDANKLAKQIVIYIKNKNKYLNKITNAYNWSQNQTWNNLKNMYYKLWKHELFV